jgi:hypothetical protein
MIRLVGAKEDKLAKWPSKKSFFCQFERIPIFIGRELKTPMMTSISTYPDSYRDDATTKKNNNIDI